MEIELIYKEQLMKGLEYFRSGDYDMAISALIHAAELNPKSFLVNFNLGRIYYKIKNWELARLYFKRSLLISPKSVDGWLTYNTSCVEFEDFEDPTYCINEALTSETSDITLRNMIGDIFYEIREDTLAQRCFDEVIELDVNNKDARHGLEMLKQRNCNMVSH